MPSFLKASKQKKLIKSLSTIILHQIDNDSNQTIIDVYLSNITIILLVQRCLHMRKLLNKRNEWQTNILNKSFRF